MGYDAVNSGESKHTFRCTDRPIFLACFMLVSCTAYSSTPKMEAKCFLCNVGRLSPNYTRHTHSCENLELNGNLQFARYGLHTKNVLLCVIIITILERFVAYNTTFLYILHSFRYIWHTRRFGNCLFVFWWLTPSTAVFIVPHTGTASFERKSNMLISTHHHKKHK
jgi:hypothetical protein